jgi:signal transduction histidine kinase
MALHDVLGAKRDEIVQRWKREVQGTLAPEAMPTLELVDHIPEFLDQIIAVLRADVVEFLPSGQLPEDGGSTAAGHGAQRLRLGFSLDSVVREYGALRKAIVDTATEAGATITLREFDVLFNATIEGIAHAVSEYSHRRDAELVRQANEHFAFIAHELRTPISSAMMAFELLKSTTELPASRTVGAIDRGLHGATELIDRTLQTARVASGVELRRQETTLKTLFDDVEADAVSEAESKGVEIRVSAASDEPVLVDPRLVRSALSNLLRNGVKYSHPGGLVELRGNIANGRVAIEVEDCCGGLPPGMVEQAFAPFVRLDSRESGFGLGLAIAKQAVDAHAGNIRVQNLPGKGCIFVLELPAGLQSAHS